MPYNIDLLGAQYPDVPAVTLPKVGGGTASFFDVSETTALASDVAQGKLFRDAAGVLTTGTKTDSGVSVVETLDAHGGTIVTITGAEVQTLNPILLRPDAEKVATYTYDKYINADEGVTIPAYSTTAQVLKASASLTPTYKVDLANYSYYVVERMLSIPEYSVNTKAKGRCEYSFAAAGYEMAAIEANNIHALIEPTRKVTSRTIAVYTTGNFSRIVYYSAATTLTTYGSAAYAVYQTVTAPALSGSTLTLKSPAFGVRGNTTYFTSTFMNALTDIRYQYVIEVWRAKKGDLDFDGWTLRNNAMAVLGCIDGETNKLR